MGRTMKDQTLTIAPKFLKRKTAIKKLREFADTRMSWRVGYGIIRNGLIHCR